MGTVGGVNYLDAQNFKPSDIPKTDIVGIVDRGLKAGENIGDMISERRDDKKADAAMSKFLANDGVSSAEDMVELANYFPRDSIEFVQNAKKDEKNAGFNSMKERIEQAGEVSNYIASQVFPISQMATEEQGAALVDMVSNSPPELQDILLSAIESSFPDGDYSEENWRAFHAETGAMTKINELSALQDTANLTKKKIEADTGLVDSQAQRHTDQTRVEDATQKYRDEALAQKTTHESALVKIAEEKNKLEAAKQATTDEEALKKLNLDIATQKRLEIEAKLKIKQTNLADKQIDLAMKELEKDEQLQTDVSKFITDYGGNPLHVLVFLSNKGTDKALEIFPDGLDLGGYPNKPDPNGVDLNNLDGDDSSSSVDGNPDNLFP